MSFVYSKHTISVGIFKYKIVLLRLEINKNGGIKMGAKIKTITVEAKKSFAFQTYTVGFEIDVSDFNSEEDIGEYIRKVQTKCRKLCQEQIDIDKRK